MIVARSNMELIGTQPVMSAAHHRFLIIDPQPVVLHGTAAMLKQQWPDADVETFGNFSLAGGCMAKFCPSLVIAEYRIDGATIVDFLDAANPGSSSRTLVFSSAEEQRAGVPAIRAGAAGFLPKTASAGELIAAVRTLLSGHTWLSGDLARALARTGIANDSTTSRLTRREQEIFTHLGQGLSVSQIATRLGLSVKTIEAHREHIKAKLGLHNAAQVTIAASRWIHDFSI
jgi:DNA-binding NarL/FixJ family response regulator